MYVFPPQCLSPGLMKNAIWYIVGLFCDACENVKGISSRTKNLKNTKNVLHTGSYYDLGECVDGGGCQQDCKSVWIQLLTECVGAKLIHLSGSYLMYAKMWSRQSVWEASSDPNDHRHYCQAASSCHLGHGTASLTSDLPRASLVFPVFCISSCHTNLSFFVFFHYFSLLNIYIFCFVYRVVFIF